MIPKESTIVATIMRKLRRISHGVAIKFHGSPFGRVGVPDILFVRDGRLYLLEVKRPGGKVTRVQRHMMSKFRTAGATVRVVTCWEDVEGVLATAGMHVSCQFQGESNG